jgi:hypothetical protein
MAVKPEIKHAITPYLIFTTAFKYEARDFVSSPDKDSENSSFSLNTEYYFRNNAVNLRFRAEKEDAVNDIYSYYRYVAGVSFQRKLFFGMTGSFNYEYQYTNYKEAETLFNKKRQDHYNSAGFSLEKKIWQSSTNAKESADLRLNYIHTWAFSNVELYEYSRDMVQLLMIYNF